MQRKNVPERFDQAFLKFDRFTQGLKNRKGGTNKNEKKLSGTKRRGGALYKYPTKRR